jgi:hypothetical protein
MTQQQREHCEHECVCPEMAAIERSRKTPCDATSGTRYKCPNDTRPHTPAPAELPECFGIEWVGRQPCNACDCYRECGEKYLTKTRSKKIPCECCDFIPFPNDCCGSCSWDNTNCVYHPIQEHNAAISRTATLAENDETLTKLVRELASTWRMRDRKLFEIIRKYRKVPIGAMKESLRQQGGEQR